MSRPRAGRAFQQLFRTKSMEAILADAEQPEFQLKRVLGPLQLTLLGIGAIIGAGIFATIGTAAAGDAMRPGAGPALMLSFVITAVVCGFTALCYAEFASLVPISGSAYTYSYATLVACITLLPLSVASAVALVVAAAVVCGLARHHIFPVLGILSCLYLIWYLPPTSWLRFAAWLNFGFVVYVGYGTLHSRLGGAAHRERPGDRAAYSAYIGGWLALLGTLLLFLMCGLDVWLEALKHHGDGGEGGAVQSALGYVFRTQPWVAPSWFLLVPLLLTVLVLCPTVISRARAAQLENDSEGVRRLARSGARLAGVVGVAAVAYLLTVASYGS